MAAEPSPSDAEKPVDDTMPTTKIAPLPAALEKQLMNAWVAKDPEKAFAALVEANKDSKHFELLQAHIEILRRGEQELLGDE